MMASAQLLDQLMIAVARNCDLGTFQGKCRFIHAIGKHLRKSNPAEYDLYTQRVARIVDVRAETIADAWRGRAAMNERAG
jgi:hypothetical protein